MTLRARTRSSAADTDVAEMFAAVSELYARYWHEYFHFAHFEHPDESWDDAFERTHRRYLVELRAAEAQNILVVACGRGAFARYLAEHTPADVLGIDLSAAQLSHALPLQRQNLRFEQLNVMDLDRLGAHFDAVACLDAACYFPDKRGALAQISSVMRAKARLLLVDWCRGEGVTGIQDELVLAPFMKYWAIPNLASANDFRKIVSGVGLEIASLQDLNDSTQPNLDYAYRRALDAVRDLSEETLPSLLWKGMKLGPRGVRLIKEQFPAALYVKAAFDLGFLRYTLVVAEKR